MNNRRTKYIVRILVTQIAIAALMFSLGLSLVFYAHGYRFNFKNFKIIKTGLLFLTSDQKQAEIFVNGKEVSDKLPLSVNLLSGSYSIEVRKDGFETWKVSAEIKQELVTDYRHIVLIRQNGTPQILNDDSKIRLVNAPIDSLAITGDRELYYNSFEIWTKDKLVTRFSSPIQKAVWYVDYAHILYQQGEEIRIIEESGENDTLLVKLNNKDTTSFATDKSGKELYYRDGDQYYSLAIR